ncbi:MAG: hypothetical protein Q8O83_01670 [bacterium]|nr:hypothetical protein [bacterium]
MKFSELYEHFFGLYGERNRYFMPDLGDRIDFLAIAIGDLQDAIRKNAHTDLIGLALARVVSRIFCIAEYFNFYTIHRLNFANALASKYPHVCAYCKTKPCNCPGGVRPAYDLNLSHGNQDEWALRDWCNHLNELYGANNKQKGIENLINRLSKEVLEMVILRFNMERRKIDRIEMIKEVGLELADALAWTIAVANYLEINLEHCVLSRYGSGCWNCKAKPCVCDDFVIRQIDWVQFK